MNRSSGEVSVCPASEYGLHDRLRTWAAAVPLVVLLVTSAHAQDSQFYFDFNGNLFVQTEASAALPQIIAQPQNQIVTPTETAAFSIVVADTRALSYQWRFNGTILSGATNDSLLLQNVTTNSEGTYRVVLTNPSGSVTSYPALLMIDSDSDKIPDSWELTYFTNLQATATADFDGDGVSNLREFLDETNPTNAASARFRLLVLREGGSVAIAPNQASYTNGELVTLTVSAAPNETFHAWLGDIVSRANPITLVMTNDKTVYARFTPIVFTWTNSLSGDWDVARNWNPNLAPGFHDSAIIPGSVTVTLNTAADCTDVTLGGVGSPILTGSGNLTVRRNLLWTAGTVSGSGDLVVLGNFLWTAGTMSGSGRTIIEPGATLEMVHANALVLNARTLENGGTVLWKGAGGMGMNPPAVITNRAGALFEMQNSAAITANNGACRFDNAGTFRKSIHVGTSTFPGFVSFNNSGTVEIQSGTLQLAGGGAHSGSLSIPTDTTLVLSGNHTADGGSSISGAGHLVVSGGNSVLAGLVHVRGGNTFSGGVASFTGNYICTNNALTISGGTVNFNGTGTITPTTITISSGTLGGSNSVTVGSVMNWSGGTMSGNGRTVIPMGATLHAAISTGAALNGRTLENGGTLLWTGPGRLTMNPPAVVTNRAGALFEFQNASPVVANNGFCRIDNAGIVRKTISVGTTSLAAFVGFNNYGMVDIRSGVLAANGSYNSSSNALLRCALGGTGPGTNHGQLRVAGTVPLNGALSVDFSNGYLPATNDSFTVVTAGTRNGAFANFFYPSNAVTMQLSNTPNSVIVRVTGVAIREVLLFPPLLSSSNVFLSWTADPSKTYRLEYSPDLNLTNWNAVPGDVTTLSNRATKLDALTSSNRFYRVRVLP